MLQCSANKPQISTFCFNQVSISKILVKSSNCAGTKVGRGGFLIHSTDTY